MRLTMALPTMTPSAIFETRARILRGRHAESDRHRSGGDLPEFFDIVLNIARVPQLRPGNALKARGQIMFCASTCI